MSFKNLLNLIDMPEDSALTGKLAGPIKAAMEARQRKVTEEAAEELITLLDRLADAKTQRKRKIKALRSQMKEQTNALDRMDREFAYGNETGNFLPLLISIGLINGNYRQGLSLEDYKEKSVIPANWKPTPNIPQPE